MAANIAQAKRWVERSKKSIFDKLNIVCPDNPEFDYLWKKLGEHKINKGQKEPTVAENFGEVWQYMHTVECSYFYFWKRQCHIFRHRLHPGTNKSEHLEIPASKAFNNY